jgi:peptidoglycan/LPS O-acetylase OafA/YrhL
MALFAIVMAASVLLRIDAGGGIRRLVDDVFQRLAHWRLLPLSLAVPLAVALFLQPDWMAWDGIPTLLAGFVPEPVTALAFGMAVLVGWLLHRRQNLLALLARDWLPYLTLAIASSLVAALQLGPEMQMRIVQWTPAAKLLHASVYALAVWSWCLGLVGLVTMLRDGESATWRYLADASYGMYLAHIPVVWGLQAWMMDWPLTWHVKYPLIVAVTLGVLLVLYRVAVRGTWVGVMLNGRRLPHRQAVSASGRGHSRELPLSQ